MLYDSEKVKNMTETEAAAYRSECKSKRQQKKNGQDSKTYKTHKEIEKLQREKDKARLSRDLALAATQQAKQQTAAMRQHKEALEADIANLQEQVGSYPADLKQCLDALSDAINKYHAANADESGQLIGFLKKIKVNQKKPDGSTIKCSVYDVWQEYRRNQEQRLQVQAEQARQTALDAQRRLPSFQSTIAQHGNSCDKDF